MSIDSDFATLQQSMATAKADADAASTEAAMAQAANLGLQAQLQSAQSQLTAAQSQLQAQPSTGGWVGVNLESTVFYARNRMFADVMLTAQPYYTGVDALGNPSVDQAVIVLGNATANDAGIYKLVANGQLNVAPQASYVSVANVQYNAATNQTTADVVATAVELADANQICLSFTNIVAGKVTDIQLYRPGSNIGDRYFLPAAALVSPFRTIRFMDFLATINSPLQTWSQRPTATTKNYSGGGCYEDALGYCRFAGKDPWLTIPYGADANWAPNLIQLIRSSTSGPTYIEWGNENWNSGFEPQWSNATALAVADKSLAYDGTGDPNILLWRWMAKKAVEVGQAAMAVYGVDDIRKCPIRPVLCGQWGNPSVLAYGLAYIESQFGPVAKYIHAIGIAPYMVCGSDILNRINSGDSTVTVSNVLAGFTEGAANPSLANPETAAFIAQGKQYGVKMLAYEFGTDDGQAQSDVAVKVATAGDPGIAAVCTLGINNWFIAGANGLNWFSLTGPWDSNGQWGATDDTLNPQRPKYQAISRSAISSSV